MNKSTGLDNIGPRVLKIAVSVITPSLTFIVNKSILSGEFPCSWKEAKVKPLFKSGAKNLKTIIGRSLFSLLYKN